MKLQVGVCLILDSNKSEISHSAGGALYKAGTVAGKNICLTPSALMIGKIMPDAL